MSSSGDSNILFIRQQVIMLYVYRMISSGNKQLTKKLNEVNCWGVFI